MVIITQTVIHTDRQTDRQKTDRQTRDTLTSVHSLVLTLFFALTSAPLASSSLTATCPLAEAHIRAVYPAYHPTPP